MGVSAQKLLWVAAFVASTSLAAKTEPPLSQSTKVVFVSAKSSYVVLEGGTRQAFKRNDILCFFLQDKRKTLCMRIVAANRTKSALLVPRDRLADFRKGTVARRISLVPAAKGAKAGQPDQGQNPLAPPTAEPVAPAPDASPVGDEAPTTPQDGDTPSTAGAAAQESMAEVPWQAVPPPLSDQPSSPEEQRIAAALDVIEQRQAAGQSADGAADTDPTETQGENKPNAAKQAAKAEGDQESKAPKRRKRAAPPSPMPIGAGFLYRLTGSIPMTFNKVAFATLPANTEGVRTLWTDDKAVVSGSALGGELVLPLVRAWNLRLRPGMQLDSYGAQIDTSAYAALQITAVAKTTIRTEAWSLWSDVEWRPLEVTEQMMRRSAVGRGPIPPWLAMPWASWFVSLRGGLGFTLANVQLESKRIDGGSETALATAQSRLGVLALRLGPTLGFTAKGFGLELSYLHALPLTSLLQRYSANVTRPEGIDPSIDLASDLQEKLGHKATSNGAIWLSITAYPASIMQLFADDKKAN